MRCLSLLGFDSYPDIKPKSLLGYAVYSIDKWACGIVLVLPSRSMTAVLCFQAL